MSTVETTLYDLTPDLNRLAKLALNIAGAQTCLIFLPIEVFTGQHGAHEYSGLLQLGGHATATKINQKHKTKSGSGIVGWVAKNREQVYVSPFTQSLETLGFYQQGTEIKSVLGLPINLEFDRNDWQKDLICGVLYLDSATLHAFDERTRALLMQVSEEISKNVLLASKANWNVAYNLNFQEFYSRTQKLVDTLGVNSVEIIRISLENATQIEQTIGITSFVAMFQKMQRLIQQVLPPQFPLIHLPNGETLTVVDNMMSSFYENKIRIISAHIGPENIALNYSFKKRICSAKKNLNLSLDDLMSKFDEEPQSTGFSLKKIFS